MTTWTPETLRNLRTILASLYPTIPESRALVVDVSLEPGMIEFSAKAFVNWFNILENAKHRNKIEALIARALSDFPDNEDLQRAKNLAPPAPVVGPEAKDWRGPKVSAQLEKIIGSRSTLVSIAYLEIGLEKAKSVVRVKLADGSSGTGFITGNDFLVTNNHVIRDQATAGTCSVECNYQLTADGLSAPIDQYKLIPNTFKTSSGDDWTLVQIAGTPSAKWGSLPLKSHQLKCGDYVNIIQHPGGGPKQISMAANVIVYLGGGRVQYLTDTLPGSSGSPVFDTEWNVVALHHSGGWLEEPNAPSKTTYYRNEGIAVDVIKV
ncbi:MAG: trypsin-like peptidase domain-containing protein [Roseiarcus sp.]